MNLSLFCYGDHPKFLCLGCYTFLFLRTVAQCKSSGLSWANCVLEAETHLWQDEGILIQKVPGITQDWEALASCNVCKGLVLQSARRWETGFYDVLHSSVNFATNMA